MIDKVSVPFGVIGGNSVELTDLKAKVRVTNPDGKSVKLSPDEFMKQLGANQDKLIAGEDFEFKSGKKDNKALKIGAAVAGTAAVVAGVVYRKNISNYIKNFSFKKLGQDIKDFFLGLGKKIKKVFKKEQSTQRTIFDGELANQPVGGAKVARETQALKDKAIAEVAYQDVTDFEALLAKNKAEHGKRYNDIRAAFKKK